MEVIATEGKGQWIKDITTDARGHNLQNERGNNGNENR